MIAHLAASLALAAGAADWTQLGGDPGGSRHSPLTQIDAGNVAALRLAWAADLGFVGRLQGAPSAWDGLLFVSTRDGVQALDAVDDDGVADDGVGHGVGLAA